MKQFKQSKSVIAAAISAILPLSAVTQQANGHYEPRMELSGKIGFGNERNLARPGFLVPLYQNEKGMAFFTATGMFDSQEAREYNAGLGYRQKFSADKAYGVYGYYDNRKTINKNTMHQATFGAELLTNSMEARVNAYIPGSEKFVIADGIDSVTPRVEGPSPQDAVGNKRLILGINSSSSSEQALVGFDAEAGYTPAAFEQATLRLAYYNFGFRDGIEQIHGARGTAILELDDMLFLELEASYDTERKWQGFAGLRLNINLGSKDVSNLSRLDKKMNNLPVRDVDIMSKEVVASSVKDMEIKSAFNLDGTLKLGNMVFLYNDKNGDNALIISSGELVENAGAIAVGKNLESVEDKLVVIPNFRDGNIVLDQLIATGKLADDYEPNKMAGEFSLNILGDIDKDGAFTVMAEEFDINPNHTFPITLPEFAAAAAYKQGLLKAIQGLVEAKGDEFSSALYDAVPNLKPTTPGDDGNSSGDEGDSSGDDDGGAAANGVPGGI